MASELAGLLLSGGMLLFATGVTNTHSNSKKRSREESEGETASHTLTPTHTHTHTDPRSARGLFDEQYTLAWSSGALQRGDTLALATPFTNPFSALQVTLFRRLAISSQFVRAPTPALALDLSFLLTHTHTHTPTHSARESEEELFLALSRSGLLLLPSAAWNAQYDTTADNNKNGGFTARFGQFFVTVPLFADAHIEVLISRLQELIAARGSAPVAGAETTASESVSAAEALPETKEEERESGEEPQSKRTKTEAPDGGNITAVAVSYAVSENAAEVVCESAVCVAVTEGVTEGETSPSPEHTHTETVHTAAQPDLTTAAAAAVAEAESDAESVLSVVSTVSLSTGVRRKVRRAKDAIASAAEKTKKKREKTAKTATESIPEGDEEHERETEREFHTPRRVRAANSRTIDLS